jgi:hypothetical protein
MNKATAVSRVREKEENNLNEITIRDENGDVQNEFKTTNYMVIALNKDDELGVIFHGNRTFSGFVAAEATRIFNKSREEDFNNE